MTDRIIFPPYNAWIQDTEMTADKLLAIAALGVIDAELNIGEIAAYNMVRHYAGEAAKQFGLEVRKTKV